MSKKVYVKKSPIHGRGLFAKKKLKKGIVLGQLETRPARKKDGMYVMWLTKKKAIEITNDFRFINHSDKPNVAIYDKDVVTLKSIKADEELTHNYDG